MSDRKQSLKLAVLLAAGEHILPEEVVNLAAEFDNFLAYGATPKAAEATEAAPAEALAHPGFEQFATMLVVNLPLKRKTLNALFKAFERCGLHLAEVEDIIFSLDVVIDELKGKHRRAIVETLVNMAAMLGVNHHDAVRYIEENAGGDLDGVVALKWAALVDDTFAQDPDDVVVPDGLEEQTQGNADSCQCPACSVGLPSPGTPLSELLSGAGAAMFAAKGVKFLGSAMSMGPTMFLEFPDLSPSDREIMVDFMRKVVSMRTDAADLSDMQLTNGYAQLPLDSFADLNSEMVKVLRNYSITKIADIPAKIEMLSTVIAKFGPEQGEKLVGHLLTAMEKEADEKGNLSPKERADVQVKLDDTRKLVSHFADLLRKGNGKPTAEPEAAVKPKPEAAEALPQRMEINIPGIGNMVLQRVSPEEAMRRMAENPGQFHEVDLSGGNVSSFEDLIAALCKPVTRH